MNRNVYSKLIAEFDPTLTAISTKGWSKQEINILEWLDAHTRQDTDKISIGHYQQQYAIQVNGNTVIHATNGFSLAWCNLDDSFLAMEDGSYIYRDKILYRIESEIGVENVFRCNFMPVVDTFLNKCYSTSNVIINASWLALAHITGFTPVFKFYTDKFNLGRAKVVYIPFEEPFDTFKCQEIIMGMHEPSGQSKDLVLDELRYGIINKE